MQIFLGAPEQDIHSHHQLHQLQVTIIMVKILYTLGHFTIIQRLDQYMFGMDQIGHLDSDHPVRQEHLERDLVQ
jgi:hypothetical protein